MRGKETVNASSHNLATAPFAACGLAGMRRNESPAQPDEAREVHHRHRLGTLPRQIATRSLKCQARGRRGAPARGGRRRRRASGSSARWPWAAGCAKGP